MYERDEESPPRMKEPSNSPLGVEWALSVIAIIFIVGTIFGGVIWVVIAVSHGPMVGAARERADLMTGLAIGWLVAGGFALFGTMDDYKRYTAERDEARREFEKASAAYEQRRIERLRQAEANRQYRIQQEQDAKRAREWARQRAEEERRKAAAETERLAREQATAERFKAWEQAFNWARGAFEQQYHGLALTLAAEQGITNADDVLKVFAEAYPHLNISTDWRMGCLRELATDRRIAAILPHLPPANPQNTRPS